MMTTTNMKNFRLVRHTSPLTTSSMTTTAQSPWKPIVEDEERQSYAYWLPFHNDNHSDDRSDQQKDDHDVRPGWTTRSQLDAWFDALHPSNFEDSHGPTETTTTTWTDAYHQGDKLLRQTAWVTLDSQCQCEYGYADTWQPMATNPKFIDIIQEITNVVASKAIFGDKMDESGSGSDSGTTSTASPINAVNLNYYPRGGGIGFHADDEFLFDGTNRPTCIVSLSLCRAGKDDDSGSGDCDGARQFVVKRRPPQDEQDSVQEFGGTAEERKVILRNGDLMTMEGMFQKYYFHAVWPGDAQDYVASDHPWTQGERINLTWRTIVQHLDGSAKCRGKTCPLAAATTTQK